VILAGVAGTGGPALVPAGTPAPLVGVARAAVPEGKVTRAVRALQEAQRSDGGFGKRPGAAASDPVTSVWAALALESVDVHPADQPAKGTTVQTYLDAHAKDLQATEDLAAMALVLDATGRRSSTVYRATVSRLTARQNADGGFTSAGGGPSKVTPTAFALLALHGANLPQDVGSRSRGEEWLRTAAAKAGGWGETPGARAQTTPTALALQALETASAPDKRDFGLKADGQTLLRNNTRADGGLSDGGASDALLTARAMQGVRATGDDPKTFLASLGDQTAESFLTGAQAADGGFGTTLRTAQILPGFNGTAFPLDEVKRASGKQRKDADDEDRENEAVSDGDPGEEAGPLSDAKTGEPTGDASPGGGVADADSPSATPADGPSGDGAAGGGATPAPVPSDAADTAAPAPAADAPATQTTESSPDPAAGTQDDDAEDAAEQDATEADPISGLVVGAQAAAATTPGGVSAGGGATDHGPAIGLGVGLLLVAGVGTQLERRRAKGPFS
jgi:hypothetical protein